MSSPLFRKYGENSHSPLPRLTDSVTARVTERRFVAHSPGSYLGSRYSFVSQISCTTSPIPFFSPIFPLHVHLTLSRSIIDSIRILRCPNTVLL